MLKVKLVYHEQTIIKYFTPDTQIGLSEAEKSLMALLLMPIN